MASDDPGRFNKELDKSLEDSFPSSDPPAISQPTKTEPAGDRSQNKAIGGSGLCSDDSGSGVTREKAALALLGKSDWFRFQPDPVPSLRPCGFNRSLAAIL